MREPAARRAAGLVPFVLVCMQLQVHTVALGPVILVIAQDAGLTLAQAGALTSVPVFCSAVLTPLAARAVGRTGTHLALALAAAGSTIAVLVRSSGSLPALFAGSALLGTAIALANIAIPTLITRSYRHQALLMSGVQTSATNVGSALAAALSAPLVAALGWQWGLAVWAVLSATAAVVWGWTQGLARPGRGERAGGTVPDVAEAVAESEGLLPHASPSTPTARASRCSWPSAWSARCCWPRCCGCRACGCGCC